MKYKLLIINILISSLLFAQSKNEKEQRVFFSIAPTSSFGKNFSQDIAVKNKISKKSGFSLGFGYERTLYEDWILRIQGGYSMVHFEQSKKSELFFDVNADQSYHFFELPISLIKTISNNKKNYVGGSMGVAAAAKHRILFKISNSFEQFQIDSIGRFNLKTAFTPTLNFFGGRVIPLNTSTNLRIEPFCTMRLGKKLTAFSSGGIQISCGVSMVLSFATRSRKEKAVKMSRFFP